MNGTRTRAFTADGFVVPCCWIDVYECRNHPIYKEFFKDELHIDNYEDIGEVEDSPIWNKLELMLDYGHKDLTMCHRMCSKKEQGTPWRDKITLVSEE